MICSYNPGLSILFLPSCKCSSKLPFEINRSAIISSFPPHHNTFVLFCLLCRFIDEAGKHVHGATQTHQPDGTFGRRHPDANGPGRVRHQLMQEQNVGTRTVETLIRDFKLSQKLWVFIALNQKIWLLDKCQVGVLHQAVQIKCHSFLPWSRVQKIKWVPGKA